MPLGLPPTIRACLFDLDGVITKTAIQHAKAWKRVFEQHGIPFDEVKDYDDYVDGKPREEGVRSLMQAKGLTPNPSTVEKIAVVSSSKHTTLVLEAAHLAHLFDAQMDGIVAASEHLQGKPNPDTYLKAAEMLHTEAQNAAVYEDALAGVEAGRNGHFGIVVGIDRAHQREALKRHGADVVVEDLSELLHA